LTTGSEARQRKELLVFVVDIVHLHEFHRSPRIFTDKEFQRLEKLHRADGDIVFVADGSGDEVEHGKKL